MTLFRIWAPRAKRAELVIRGKRHPMTAGKDGWWFTEVSSAGANTEYGFALDGGGPLADPRSPWQPGGISGPSITVDHGAFSWTDPHWQAAPLSAAIIYELHIGTFTPEGTFQAAIQRLDHLAHVGITHIELMPIAQFSGNWGWGYDGTYLYAPHHAYGNPEQLKQFVNACHQHGIAVILDVVYNHLGPAGNHLDDFGPYFTDRYSTPWGAAVNFDGADSAEVRRLFCDNALMWLRDYHFDGLRLDAVHAIIDTSAVHFLEQLVCEVTALEAQIGRHLVLIAESDLNDPRIVRPREIGGYGIHAQWGDDFHHALHGVLTGERDGYYSDFGSLADLSKALRQAFVYDGRYSPFRRRPHGRRPHGISGHAFLGYLQNHDQIGNRAIGERSSHLLNVGRLKIAAALILTAPFVPMLFQGEEWGATAPFLYFTNHEDPELGRRVTEGRRREFSAFGWDPADVPDPQARETFQLSKLDWSELDEERHADLLEWHCWLIQLRRKVPALSDGCLDRVEVNFDDSAKWFVVKRGAVVVACNLNSISQNILAQFPPGSEILLASDDLVRVTPDGGIQLPADSVAIVRTEVGR
jgi:maltooligosyltrehalose trehalohydrolase